MSAEQSRECGICYETKLDFIRCVQCVNEVCLACFIRLSKTVCPFCRHAFVEPNPNEPSAFVARWLFSSETDDIRRMLRETHPDWTLEMVNETYIRTMRVIRHHERSISFVRHVTVQYRRDRTFLRKISLEKLAQMAREVGLEVEPTDTHKQIAHRLACLRHSQEEE